MSQQLTKEAILNCVDRDTRVVEVPEWGGSVTIKEMSGRQRDRFENLVLNEKARKSLPDLKAWLVAQSVINPDGSLMFNEAEVGQLATKSAKALFTVVQEIRDLNGLNGTAVKEAEKNSESAPNDSNGSD